MIRDLIARSGASSSRNWNLRLVPSRTSRLVPAHIVAPGTVYENMNAFSYVPFVPGTWEHICA